MSIQDEMMSVWLTKLQLRHPRVAARFATVQAKSEERKNELVNYETSVSNINVRNAVLRLMGPSLEKQDRISLKMVDSRILASMQRCRDGLLHNLELLEENQKKAMAASTNMALHSRNDESGKVSKELKIANALLEARKTELQQLKDLSDQLKEKCGMARAVYHDFLPTIFYINK